MPMNGTGGGYTYDMRVATGFSESNCTSHSTPAPSSGGITDPGPHDCLLGRGGSTNNHEGNVNFRKLVNQHKIRYLACSKIDKPNVAREVVAIWRRMQPRGRFLERVDKTSKKEKEAMSGKSKKEDPATAVWVEVNNKKAREKASQVSYTVQ